MSAYRFETIAAGEAANFGPADTLSFDGTNAAQVTVLFAADHVTLQYAGRSMDFGSGIQGQQNVRLADGSELYIGTNNPDSVSGTAQNDGLYGGAGADTLDGGDGGDLLQGNQGDDSLMGGAGSDIAYGGQDNDTIRLAAFNAGGTETNFANGNKGDDVVAGGPGADILLGGQGSDIVSGGDGADFVNGNLGDDILGGDAGDDTLSGEGGADFMTGGDGADLFLFAAGSSNAGLQQLDQILDWSSADHIRIDGVRAGYAEVTAPMMPGYMYGGYDYGPTPGDESYAALLALANQTFAADASLGTIAARSGFDVIVFADTDNDRMADLAIVLAGASLTDVSATNFG
jgi:Ca2+-binding RTX toxin-like protein